MKTMTPETKLKISQALKRYASTPEGRAKLRNARLGKRHTRSTIVRIRKSNLAHHQKFSAEELARRSKRMKRIYALDRPSYFTYLRIRRMLNSGCSPRPGENDKFDKEYQIYLYVQKKLDV